VAVYVGDYNEKNTLGYLYNLISTYTKHLKEYPELNEPLYPKTEINMEHLLDVRSIQYGVSQAAFIIPESRKSEYIQKCDDINYSWSERCQGVRRWFNPYWVMNKDDGAALVIERTSKDFTTEEVKIEFVKNGTGENIGIPPLNNFGMIYYLDNENVMNDSSLELIDKHFGNIYRGDTEIDHLKYHDSGQWVDMSFVKDLVKNLYLNGKTPQKVSFRGFSKDKASGKVYIRLQEGWYREGDSAEEIGDDDLARQQLKNLLFSYYVDPADKKLFLLTDWYGQHIGEKLDTINKILVDLIVK